jgi:hypothetical protein
MKNKRKITLSIIKKDWIKLPDSNKEVLVDVKTTEEKEIEVYQRYEYGIKDGKLQLLISLVDTDNSLSFQSKDAAKQYFKNKCNDFIKRQQDEIEGLKRAIETRQRYINETKQELQQLNNGDYETVEQDYILYNRIHYRN